MLTDWIHWLSSLPFEAQIATVLFLLLVDVPRYLISFLLMGLWDLFRAMFRRVVGSQQPTPLRHCPSVGVVLPGHNEADTIEATLQSLCGSYPRLQIVVIDDGSSDGMGNVVRQFARAHPEVRLLQRAERGGKASAMNWALHYLKTDVVVCVDADSHLGPNAIWEIVQPLADPSVGAVSGAILARNPHESAVARFQAQEYLRSIFLGRQLNARLGILGIISGAFGAFRRSAVAQVGGWNVGPGEDCDLTQSIRKCGYEIAFAPYAQCFTNVPTTWPALVNQRLRWDRSVIRIKLRQHVDNLFGWRKNFRITNCWDSIEALLFCVIGMYGMWAYAIWLMIRTVFLNDYTAGAVIFTNGLVYLALYPIHVALVAFYSNAPARDAMIMLPMWPFVTFYHVVLSAIRFVAVTGELFMRKSFRDNFYPARCRLATWQW